MLSKLVYWYCRAWMYFYVWIEAIKESREPEDYPRETRDLLIKNRANRRYDRRFRDWLDS